MVPPEVQERRTENLSRNRNGHTFDWNVPVIEKKACLDDRATRCVNGAHLTCQLQDCRSDEVAERERSCVLSMLMRIKRAERKTSTIARGPEHQNMVQMAHRVPEITKTESQELNAVTTYL